jgi:hypothetical protein
MSIDWSIPADPEGPRLALAEPWDVFTTEDVEKASENLSENERWHVLTLERRAFVDTYSEEEVREKFVAYMRGRARRTFNGHALYMLRWPHRSWTRVVRKAMRYGGGQKLAGGWWRASFVEMLPWGGGRRYADEFEGDRVYGGVRVNIWFNPATGRWKVG